MGGPLAIAAALGAAAWAVRGRSSQIFGESVWVGPRDRREIALTFDDGPSPSTERLLDVLNVPATFFVCGVHAAKYPSTLRRQLQLGHELGNHTQTHSSLWLRSPGFIRDEIGVGQQSIFDAAGVYPQWFRAPYGVRWPGVGEAQRDLRLTGAMWSVIGNDWKLDGKQVAARLMGGARNGAILCLHDGRELQQQPDIRNTIEAVRIAVPQLLDMGYRFRTMTELFERRAVE